MINQELIFSELAFQTKEEVFAFLAKIVVEKNFATDEKEVLTALKKREAEGTTGMMDGFAIPHAKSAAIIKPTIVVVKSQQEIDWNSMDGLPVKYILALFIPENEAGTTHLKILSQVAKMLMKSEFKKAFVETNSSEKLAALILEKLER